MPTANATPSTARPIGLAHLSAMHLSPLDLVDLAAAAGCQAVGLNLIPGPSTAGGEIAIGGDGALRLRERLRETSIFVQEIGFVFIGEEFDAAALRPSLELGAFLGARRLGVCCSDPEPDRLLARFRALCDLAATHGLGVDVENLGWLPVATFRQAEAFVIASERDNAGLLFDAAHFADTGGEAADLAGTTPRLVHTVHLSDVAEPLAVPGQRRPLSTRMAPGRGVLPLGAYLARLPESATLMLEVPLAGEAEARGQLVEMLEALRNFGASSAALASG